MLVTGLIDGDNSEVEDLLDINDLVGDAEYHPPQQETSSSEEDSSGCEDPIPQPSNPIRGRKHHYDEHEGPHSDCNIASDSQIWTQQDEAMSQAMSLTTMTEDTRTKPSRTVQKKSM